MSRKTHRPAWPLYRWPHAGESTAHAACREWDLPCPCAACAALPFSPEQPEPEPEPE